MSRNIGPHGCIVVSSVKAVGNIAVFEGRSVGAVKIDRDVVFAADVDVFEVGSRSASEENCETGFAFHVQVFDGDARSPLAGVGVPEIEG